VAFTSFVCFAYFVVRILKEEPMQNHFWIAVVTWLLVAAQALVLVAGGNDPVPVEQPSTPAESQKAATELDQVLADWEKAASNIRRLDCNFSRFKYDKTFAVEKRGEGTIAIESAQRARYRLAPAILPQGAVARKQGPGGNPYQLKAEEPECWHWTGPQLFRIKDQERAFESTEVPANGRIQWLLCELDVLDAFFLGRPYLLGMPAAELKKQFKVTLNKNDADDVWLTLIPRDSRVAANVTKATLILNRHIWLAKAVKIQDPTGAELVHVFKNMRINSKDRSADDLSKPNLDGYREIKSEQAPQTDPAN
jgi:hypothetical protein